MMNGQNFAWQVTEIIWVAILKKGAVFRSLERIRVDEVSYSHAFLRRRSLMGSRYLRQRQEASADNWSRPVRQLGGATELQREGSPDR